MQGTMQTHQGAALEDEGSGVQLGRPMPHSSSCWGRLTRGCCWPGKLSICGLSRWSRGRTCATDVKISRTLICSILTKCRCAAYKPLTAATEACHARLHAPSQCRGGQVLRLAPPATGHAGVRV